MSNDLKTYEVRVLDQITRQVVCAQVDERDGFVWFLGSDGLSCSRVAEEDVI